MMKTILSSFLPQLRALTCFLLTGLASFSTASAQSVDTELMLLLDDSAEVRDDDFNPSQAFEYQRQVMAYVSYFQNPTIWDRDPDHRLAVSFSMFGGWANHVNLTGWQLLESAADSADFADEIMEITGVSSETDESFNRPFRSFAAVGEALIWGTNEIINNSFTGNRLVIDLTGDSPDNHDRFPGVVIDEDDGRIYAEDNHVEVNAIGVIDSNDTGAITQFLEMVTEDGFGAVVDDFDQSFRDALRQKIDFETELACGWWESVTTECDPEGSGMNLVTLSVFNNSEHLKSHLSITFTAGTSPGAVDDPSTSLPTRIFELSPAAPPKGKATIQFLVEPDQGGNICFFGGLCGQDSANGFLGSGAPSFECCDLPEVCFEAEECSPACQCEFEIDILGPYTIGFGKLVDEALDGLSEQARLEVLQSLPAASEMETTDSEDSSCRRLFFAKHNFPSCWSEELTYWWYVNGQYVANTPTLSWDFPSSGSYEVCVFIYGSNDEGKPCRRRHCESFTIDCKPTSPTSEK